MAYFTTSMPNVASEIFDGEIVVADFVGGSYFSLVGTAASIWQGLRAGRSTDEVAEWLGAHFGQPVEGLQATIEQFAAQLVTAGLAAPLPDAPEALPLPELTPAIYLAPSIERHDDLQDLLLLDPVHDVAEAGWPNLPPVKA